MNSRTMDHLNAPNNRQALIEAAVKDSIMRYIALCKARVPSFVETQFSFRGALRIHRKALGKDLYRGPLNLLWAVPSIVVTTVSSILKKCGADKPAHYLDQLPQGFQTDVQKEVNWLIYTELLQLPYKQDGRESTNDALLGEILNDPRLSALIAYYLVEISIFWRSRAKVDSNGNGHLVTMCRVTRRTPFLGTKEHSGATCWPRGKRHRSGKP